MIWLDNACAVQGCVGDFNDVLLRKVFLEDREPGPVRELFHELYSLMVDINVQIAFVLGSAHLKSSQALSQARA